eukprot:scaffold89875_cov66-Phaeocystis_antarctica.AAC.7
MPLLLHDDLPRGAPAASHAPTSIDACTSSTPKSTRCAFNAYVYNAYIRCRSTICSRESPDHPVPRHPHVPPFFAGKPSRPRFGACEIICAHCARGSALWRRIDEDVRVAKVGTRVGTRQGRTRLEGRREKETPQRRHERSSRLLRVPIGDVHVKVEQEQAEALGERYERREERDHRLIHLAPQEGYVVGQRCRAIVAGEDKGAALGRALWRSVGVAQACEERCLLPIRAGGGEDGPQVGLCAQTHELVAPVAVGRTEEEWIAARIRRDAARAAGEGGAAKPILAGLE